MKLTSKLSWFGRPLAGAWLALLALALAPGVRGAERVARAAAPARVTTAAPAAALEDQEREIDKQHLQQIYRAIQAYRQKHGESPNWLSDLVPEFLSDTNVLMSPVEVRTGRSVLWGNEDPKLKTSYIYEFNHAPAGGLRDQDIPLTMKEWKTLQMEEFGPVVPLLRCHLHDPILNVSYSGEIYETALFWESDTNTLALMARLGPGPGAEEGQRMRVTVVDAASGEPVAGAEVLGSNRRSEFGPLPPRRQTTDAKGQSEANLGGKRPKGITLQVARDGYATTQMQWGEGDIPAEWTVKLQQAVRVGGVVKDDQGEPIAGVTVVVSGLTRDPVGQMIPIEYESVTTDPAGKWSSRRVPANFDALNFKLSHPEFIPGEYDQATPENATGKVLSRESLRAGAAAMQLEPGIVIQGTVADETGKPVAKATVHLLRTEEDRPLRKQSETDAAGHFRFVVTEPGGVTVFAEAAGLAPKSLPVETERGLKPVSLTLAKGRMVTGRVVDAAGKPVAEANVSVSSWNNLGPLQWRTRSDADGRFTWDSAPAENTLLAFSKPGFLPTVQPVPTSEVEAWSIRLETPFRLSGKVIDAETREPIKKFKLTFGTSYGGPDEPVRWDRNQVTSGTNGAYSVTSTAQRGNYIKYQVTADGYWPAATPAYLESGTQVFDFELKRGTGLSGVLELPNGDPVAGATIILADKTEGAYMDKEGEFRSGLYQSERAVTDAHGRFQFAPRLDAHSVLVAHEQGYAEVRADKVAATGKVVLEPWGRVKGILKVGKPAPNQCVALNNIHYPYGDGERQFPALSLYLKTQPEEDGSFVFEKVPPGERKLYLQYKFQDGPGIIPLSHGTFVKVKPGETAEAVIGGTGRPVVGRIEVIGGDASAIDWLGDVHSLQPKVTDQPGGEAPYNRQFASNEERQKVYQEYAAKQRAYWTSEAGRARQQADKSYVLVFSEDGSFRVDAVPAGTYTLNVAPAEPGEQPYMRKSLGNLTKEVTVPPAPEDKPDEPFDLGTLELKLRQAPSRSTP